MHLPDKSQQNVKLTIELLICCAKTHFRTVKLWLRNRTIFSSHTNHSNKTIRFNTTGMSFVRVERKKSVLHHVTKRTTAGVAKTSRTNGRIFYQSTLWMYMRESYRKQYERVWGGTRVLFFFLLFFSLLFSSRRRVYLCSDRSVSVDGKKKKQTNDKSFSLSGRYRPRGRTTVANDPRSFSSWLLFFNLNDRRNPRPLYGRHRTIPLANDYLFHLSFYNPWCYTSLFLFFILVCREISTTA